MPRSSAKTQAAGSKRDLAREHERVLKALQGALLSSAESLETAEHQEDRIDWEYENQRLSFDNRREKRKLRQRWNALLTVLVVTGFVLSYTLILLIGFGVLSFDNNAFAVPSVVAAGIVETYGLAKLAIKYFFSEDGVDGHKRQRPER